MPPDPSSASVRIISLNRDELLARLRAMAARLLAERPEVIEVRLFGSLARGDQLGTSDVDLLVVVSQTRRADPVERILDYIPYFELERGLDLLVFTRGEMDHRLADNDPFLRRLAAESIPLT